jgi:nicotinate phosphoribosyltransferase
MICVMRLTVSLRRSMSRMNVSADAPYLDMAYKLVCYDGRNVLKTSPGKETWTGEKQVYRFRGPDGRFRQDRLALRDEAPPPSAEPLLRTVMTDGHPVAEARPPLREIRGYCASQVALLPDALVRLREPASYPVSYSDRLVGVQQALKAEIARHEKLVARTVAASGGRGVAGPEATFGPAGRIDGPGRR